MIIFLLISNINNFHDIKENLSIESKLLACVNIALHTKLTIKPIQLL